MLKALMRIVLAMMAILWMVLIILVMIACVFSWYGGINAIP